MADPIYADTRLAQVYDAFEPERHDLDAYVALADELSARSVVDLGCGTGCLALRLARSGRAVTGVDPAAASIEVARGKEDSELVRWCCGDADALPRAADVDLVAMTGNTVQALVTDEAWHHALDRVRETLRPAGHVVFESRRPERREWEDWASRPPVVAEIPDLGPVERRLDVIRVDLPLVTFRFVYRFPDRTLTSDSTVRFRSLDQIETGLTARGFHVVDVREAPDRPGRELVVIATPAPGPIAP